MKQVCYFLTLLFLNTFTFSALGQGQKPELPKEKQTTLDFI